MDIRNFPNVLDVSIIFDGSSKSVSGIADLVGGLDLHEAGLVEKAFESGAPKIKIQGRTYSGGLAVSEITEVEGDAVLLKKYHYFLLGTG